MFTAEARLETDRASRYLVQLCRHASQMGQHGSHRPPTGRGGHVPPEVQHVEWSDSHGLINTEWGRCTVQATSDALTLRVEAADEEALQRLQDRVTHRVETIGRRDDLKVNWQRPEEAESDPPAPDGRSKKWRGRVTTIGLIAVGVLIVAVHLGLFGTALATSAWTGWATNIFLVVVLVKVLIVAGHVVLGRVVLRRVFRGHRLAIRQKTAAHRPNPPRPTR